VPSCDGFERVSICFRIQDVRQQRTPFSPVVRRVPPRVTGSMSLMMSAKQYEQGVQTFE